MKYTSHSYPILASLRERRLYSQAKIKHLTETVKEGTMKKSLKIQCETLKIKKCVHLKILILSLF